MIATDLAVPKPVKLISAGTDFQIDRCEIEFVGWGEGEENWGLGYFIIPGDFSQMNQKGRPWAYDQLEGVLTRQFIREDGARLNVAAVGFDTGYAHAQRALYQYLRPRYGRGFYACKGAGRSGRWAPMVAKGRRDERIRLFIIGTNRVKALVYDRATISVPGPGYMHIPKTDDYGEEWFKQLQAEDSHTVREAGIEMRIFEMPTSPSEDGSSRNEALDIRVLATVALYIRGPVAWDLEERRNLATIPNTRPEPPKARTIRRQRGNLLSGLRLGW